MPATGTHPPNWINSNSTKGPSPSGSANADLRRAAVTALLSFSSFHPARGCRSHHLPALGQGALGHFAPMTVSGNGGLYFCRCRPHELAVAIITRCISVHTEKALEHGAALEKNLRALGVVVALCRPRATATASWPEFGARIGLASFCGTARQAPRYIRRAVRPVPQSSPGHSQFGHHSIESHASNGSLDHSAAPLA